MNDQLQCKDAEQAASLRMDRRLDVAAGKALDRHLAVCIACSTFSKQIVALREQVARVPEAFGPHDLAAAVRRRAERPAARFAPMQSIQKVAAVVIAALSLFVAYTLGRLEATRDGLSTIVFELPETAVKQLLAADDLRTQKPSAPPSLEALSPRATESLVSTDAKEPTKDEVVATPPIRKTDEYERPFPTIVPSPQAAPTPAPKLVFISDDDRKRLARAGRAMLADLAVIEKIPQNRQRPLLESQLRHFGLADFATDVAGGKAACDDEPHRDLALFVTDLEAALKERGDSLVALRDASRTDALFEALKDFPPPQAPPMARRTDRRHVVDEVGGELGEDDRRALDELLSMKESWIEGSYAPAVRFATNDKTGHDEQPLDPFAAAMQATIISALTEAGITQWDPAQILEMNPKRNPGIMLDLDALERASMELGKSGRGYVIKVQVGTIRSK